MQWESKLEERRNWCIYLVMTAATVISNFHQIGLSAISIEVGEALRVDAAQLALLAAAFAYPYAAMQIPAGLLADTLGSRKSVTGALLLVFSGTVIFACSTGLYMAIFGRICIGAGCAIILVPLMKLTAVWFSPASYARLIAVSFTVGALGLVFATSPMAFLSETVGWRNIYLLLAVFTLACAALVWIIVRDTREPTAVQGAMSREWLCHAMKTVFGNKNAWVLGGWCFCQAGLYFSFIGLWAGQFLSKGLGFDPLEAGGILTLPACSLVVSPLLTWAAERCGSPRKVIIVLSFSTLLLSLPLAMGLPRLAAPLLALYFLCFSISAIGGIALIFSMGKELFPVEYAGTISGFINIFPFTGTAVVQQAVGILVAAGLSAEASPYDAFTKAFLLLPAFAAITCILSLKVRDGLTSQPD